MKTVFRHLIAPEEKSYYDVFEEINSETGTLHKSLWWANWLVWYSGVQKKPTKQCLMNEFEFYRVFGFQVIINNMFKIKRAIIKLHIYVLSVVKHFLNGQK